MTPEEMYDLVLDATRQGIREAMGPDDVHLSRRLVGGRVVFHDAEDRIVKEIPVATLLTKVTAVRERMRVLEQKINNHDSLDEAEKATLQAYITRAYGSLTTFNFLFLAERDTFKGTGGS